MICKEDYTLLDNRYVLKTECNNTVNKQNEETNELKVVIAKVGTKLNIIIGILGAIGVAILGAVVELIFNL